VEQAKSFFGFGEPFSNIWWNSLSPRDTD